MTDLTRYWTQVTCIPVSHSNHTLRCLVFFWDCKWNLIHAWFCPIYLIHQIGRNFLHFEKKIRDYLNHNIITMINISLVLMNFRLLVHRNLLIRWALLMHLTLIPTSVCVWEKWPMYLEHIRIIHTFASWFLWCNKHCYSQPRIMLQSNHISHTWPVFITHLRLLSNLIPSSPIPLLNQNSKNSQ